MKQLRVKPDVRVHMTRLEQRLLAQFSDMQVQKKIVIFLWYLKKTRRDDFGNAKPFTGFPTGY